MTATENGRPGKGPVPVGDGTFALKVSRDGLEVVLVARQEGQGEVPTGETLAALLREAGVVHGILTEPERRGTAEWLVARGTPPQPGDNARIRFFVKPPMVRAPKLKGSAKSGRVDYRELGGIVNVREGQLLFEKVPPTAGVPGTTVRGDTIAAKPGRDAKVKLGPGVRQEEGSERYVATCYGRFVMADDKASVFDEYVVNGDVDLSTGNISFAGRSLVINGAVLPGFKVRCRGNVSIAKGVNGAAILAGGSVTVLGGVVGEGARITAIGDITVDFCENGPLLSTTGSVVVKDVLVQARVRANGDLRAVDGKGLVVGGSCILGGSLWVRELGSDAGVVTEITVGLAPSLARRKEELTRAQEIWPARMSETLKNITGLEKMKKEAGGTLPPDKEALLAKYKKFLPKVTEKVNALTELEQEIAVEIDRAANQAIFVAGKVYHGVRVTIGNATRVFSAEEEGVSIRLHRRNLEIVTKKLTKDEAAMFAD